MVDNTNLKSNTIKFLCSYGGKILPRYPDGILRYHGGSTRVLSVHRSISFSELLLKLGELCGSAVITLRCQLPSEDLDALVSITSDEDLANLIEEYDRAAGAVSSSSLKIRAFLSPPRKVVSPASSSSTSNSSKSSSSPYATCNSGIRTPRFPAQENWCFQQSSKPPMFPKSAGKAVHYGYGNHCLVHNGNHWQ